MEVCLIGLGKMGLMLAQNMQRNGISVKAYDISNDAQEEAQKHGIPLFHHFSEITAMAQPRIVWSMLPAGNITRQTILEVASQLSSGDVMLDGGNSFFEDSIYLFETLSDQNIHFFDVGTSGGTSGALTGGNFMIGGASEAFPLVEPLFKKIAAPDGYLFCGAPGSGHYLKMVHNGIEYGMMQAIGEGFDVLQHSPFDYDNEKVAKLWNHGSVIRSWLMELAKEAFAQDQQLENIKGIMHSSGEGRWTVEEALKRQVAIPVITTSLMMRYRSLEEDTFSGKVVAALRNGFGGHDVTRSN